MKITKETIAWGMFAAVIIVGIILLGNLWLMAASMNY